jgi:hypothetical protein
MLYKRVLRHDKSLATLTLLFILFITFQQIGYASIIVENDTIGFDEYRGIVVDSKTKNPLVFASLTINGTNISTVTNTQGNFLLKVPKKLRSSSVTISFLGYTSKVKKLSDFDIENTTVRLETYIEELSEVSINTLDAYLLVREVLKRRGDNYFNHSTKMTAFYRETIKKRRTYVSLSEAVLEINKQSYTSFKSDAVKLYKARKSTDYKKIDTLTIKLKGGPYNTLYMDIIKNSDKFFTEDMWENYEFTFDESTKIDDRLIYVVKFKQRKLYTEEALFYGNLYIDAQSLALTAAKFNLNLEDKEMASRFFIVKKPRKVKTTPIEASYLVDYREKDGRWFYSYSRIELGFKVDWKSKLFNSVYYTTFEMAVTDWEKNTMDYTIKPKERLKTTVFMIDEASGFSDPEFWGEYNVIEPEKSIESAIKKIQRQLRRLNSNKNSS